MSFGNRLYVGNLPMDVTVDEIERLFHRFGRISFISDIKRPLGGPALNCFAFVTFEDDRAAQDAVMARDRYLFGGRNISVQYTRQQQRTPPKYAPAAFTLRIYPLPQDTTWQRLKDWVKGKGVYPGYTDVVFDSDLNGLVGRVGVRWESDVEQLIKAGNNTEVRVGRICARRE